MGSAAMRRRRPTVPAQALPLRLTPVSSGGPGRRMGLSAALAVLADNGLGSLTVGAMARCARASKATVYRRGHSRHTLRLDAMDAAFQPLPRRNRGRFGRISWSSWSMPGTSSPMRHSSTCWQPSLTRRNGTRPWPDHFELTQRRREPGRNVLRRAQERGEVSLGQDSELVFDWRLTAHRLSPDS